MVCEGTVGERGGSNHRFPPRCTYTDILYRLPILYIGMVCVGTKA